MKPLVHVSWIGLITLYAVGLPIITPVPLNPRNFRNPRAGYIMSILAGPVSSLLIATLAVGLFRICLLVVSSEAVLVILQDLLLSRFAFNCVNLTVLMLLPLPFYDGYQILSLFLPAKWTYMTGNTATSSCGWCCSCWCSGALTPILGFFTYGLLRGIYFIFGL